MCYLKISVNVLKQFTIKKIDSSRIDNKIGCFMTLES